MIRSHLQQPLRLKPLETASFVVDELDRSGGTRANFVVAWQGPGEVSPPWWRR
ncbi:MAG: DUF3124 domain-containing protein [Candidatus Handelsmanbacteria bacterium]|nr:DUF3124 domain-containing protein [Candidatus Handelsmanbacteria bacterium]